MKLAALMLIAGTSLAVAGPPTVYVNGRPIAAEVIEQNGKLYVPVATLQSIPGVNVVVQSNEVRIAAAPAPAPVVVVQPAAPPIYGRLTYNAGLFRENPPDVGAQVWLLRREQIAALAQEAGGTAAEPIPTRATGWLAKLDRLYPKSVADRDGRFGFTGVAPGEYLLVFSSKRANSLSARDRQGKMRFKPVTVREGDSVDASYDFGVTAYKD